MNVLKLLNYTLKHGLHGKFYVTFLITVKIKDKNLHLLT